MSERVVRRAGARPRAAWMALALLAMGLAAAVCVPARAADGDRRADKLFETAKGAYDMERWEDAATKFYDFMAAAPYDPRNDEAQYYVGRAYMHRNYLNKAIKEFSYLIQDFPKSNYATLALHNRARCYLKTRERDKAIADMEKVVARSVQHGWRWNRKDAMKRQLGVNHREDVFWLAKHYMKEKEHEKAIAAYSRLPNEFEAFRYIVNVHYGLGNFDKIKVMIDGLKQKNKHQAFKYLIEFYAKKKAYNQLKAIFSKLLQEKKPDRHTDDLVRTTAENFRHFGWDKWEEAMEMVAKHYARQARWASYRLAHRRWGDINYQDEMELFVLKYKQGHDVDWVLRHKAITLERHGKAEEARKDYRRMGDTAQGHWYVAETYHGRWCKKKNRDLKAAIKEYEKIRKAFYDQRWSAMSQWRIASLYREQKQVDKAVEAYRHIAKRWPSLRIEKDQRPWRDTLRHNLGRHAMYFAPAGLLALGDTLREAKRYEDAVMEYRGCVRKYPKTEEASWAAYRTALCYEGMADRETAIKVLKSTLRRYGKTSAGSDAHTRLETVYKIPDTEVADDLDFFAETENEEKNYIEDRGKLKRR